MPNLAPRPVILFRFSGGRRPPSPVGGVVGRAGRKARGAAAETLADCVQVRRVGFKKKVLVVILSILVGPEKL